MAANLDKKMLNGFSREVKSYLPSIREGIENLLSDSSQHDTLEETLRYIHTIKGASALMGLLSLSQVTSYIEELLEGIASGSVSLEASHNQWLSFTIERIDPYLECLLNGEGENQNLIDEIEHWYFRINNSDEYNDNDLRDESVDSNVKSNDCIADLSLQPIYSSIVDQEIDHEVNSADQFCQADNDIHDEDHRSKDDNPKREDTLDSEGLSQQDLYIQPAIVPIDNDNTLENTSDYTESK